MAWYIQPEITSISQKSVGIFPPHFPFGRRLCFFLQEAMAANKEKARTKQEAGGRMKASKRIGEKFLPAAGAGSNWVDQGRQEPKKRPWYRIDFF